jgi:4-hydroxy-tetrahydrodipicolinate synthase
MTEKSFRGAGTAMVTPFKADGSVDEQALRRFVDFQITEGIDMLVPCGTTGENATMESHEVDRVIEIVVEQAGGRVPVVAGAGSNSTAKAIQNTRRAKKLGADAVLSVGPYYNKPTQEGYYEHYKAITESEDIPVVVYNIPGRTGSNIEARTMLRIAGIPNIVGVKESSGNIQQIMEIIKDAPPTFNVLAGDDFIALPVIAAGGVGVVSVVSNELPGMMRTMIDAARRNDFVKARELHYKLLPLMTANFIESSPIPVKAALAMMGMMDAKCRLPMVPMTSGNREKLRQALEEIGALDHAGARRKSS